jgi:hypothetical protein
VRKFKEVLDIIQAIVTVAAVLVGGVWTYILFIKERHDYPHLNLEHIISHVLLPKHTVLLRVGIKVENIGQVRALTSETIIRVQQILPIAHCAQPDKCISVDLNKEVNNINSDFDRLDWPLLVKRVSSDGREIEPSERENLDFEFVVPDYIKVVRVYTFIRVCPRTSCGIA